MLLLTDAQKHALGCTPSYLILIFSIATHECLEYLIFSGSNSISSISFISVSVNIHLVYKQVVQPDKPE